MLFNSYVFIFAFLPVVVCGYWLAQCFSRVIGGKLFLAVMSLIFYGWWNYRYAGLILASIGMNYVFAHLIFREQKNQQRQRFGLAFGVAANLMILGYFKYASFFATTVNQVLNTNIPALQVILPLGISFFTFEQIGLLVDIRRGVVKQRPRLIEIALFVLFFPHLIAGPIISYRNLIPQFDHALAKFFSWSNLGSGLLIFFAGLFKKAVLADQVAPYANTVFDAVASGQVLAAPDAWVGALCYTMQLYFDFSGYSDMAIGLGVIFGVTLPLNFNSPYKATGSIEFWKRWHMSLTNYFTTYLNAPIGLFFMRLAAARKIEGGQLFWWSVVLPTVLTFGLIGLWHGAGMTFVLFGVMHGIYFCLNRFWRMQIKDGHWRALQKILAFEPLSILINFVSLMIAYVVFRSADMNAAFRFLSFMLGSVAEKTVATFNWDALYYAIGLLAIAWFLPNTQQIFAAIHPLSAGDRSSSTPITWQPNVIGLCVAVLMTLFAIMSISDISPFLYFQF